jgi:orotidine-5'-phosphate decarboxylase
MNQVIVALDVDHASRALALAEELRGAVGAVKVGKQLFTAAGPDIVRRLVGLGHRVFLDLKYHDIPNTVAGASAEAARLGVWLFDVHASGGSAMMRAARDAAHESAVKEGVRPPLVIGITVLTSFDEDTLASIGVSRSIPDQVDALARLAEHAGLDGVVASPQEVRRLRALCGREFVLITPGIRGADATVGAAGPAGRKDDQVRTMTPSDAVAAGASYIVVGRPIVAAADPRAAAEAIAASIGARNPSG